MIVLQLLQQITSILSTFNDTRHLLSTEKDTKRDISNVGAKALLSLHPDKTQPAYVEELELSDRDFATAVINSKW